MRVVCSWRLRRGGHFDRQPASCPILEGAVVENGFDAERTSGEHDSRSLQADVAIRDDAIALRLLTLLDGTRNRTMLQEALGPDYHGGAERLEALLRFFGKVALLIR